MRTTVDLPADLLRAAKMRAARRGETLKDLFTRALGHEVTATERPGTGRLVLPLIGPDQEPRSDLSNADIAALLAADDAERYGR